MAGIIQIKGHSLHPDFLTRDSVVCDLGANHGEFARTVAERFGCRCLTVEGNARLAAQMEPHPRVQGVHALVGDVDRTVEFSITSNDQCSSVLVPLTSEVVSKETVRMISFANILNLAGAERIDLVKMDIEGAEVMAIDACSDETLLRIGQFALEFHDALGMTSHADIMRIGGRLRSLGFYWIRGTFSNYEDNLFINRRLCPLSTWELWVNCSVFRFRNGAERWMGRWQRRIAEFMKGSTTQAH